MPFKNWALRRSFDIVFQRRDCALDCSTEICDGDDHGERDEPRGNHVFGKLEACFIFQEIADCFHGFLPPLAADHSGFRALRNI